MTLAIMRPETGDRRPTFCTLFQFGNELITKDVGLIPYGMHRFEGYDAFITAYPEEDFPYLKHTPGLRVERVPKLTGNWLKDSCAWLKRNAKRIDVLNLYHLRERSLIHALVYRVHNPKGKIYLKFDSAPKPERLKLWRNIGAKIALKMCSLSSTELSENEELLSKIWHHKIICVPDPINPNELRDYRPFSERSNVILTAGRLGARQKATEILLAAFARIAPQIPSWTLKLAGRIEENLNIADDFYAEHPELRERVIFAGEIVNRDEMSALYREAKVFAFPSRWETFGIALTEAMANGCFCVCSNIPASTSLTENFKFALGSDVDDIDGLASNLLQACTHESESERLALEGRDATLIRCDLKRVCSIISEGLN